MSRGVRTDYDKLRALELERINRDERHPKCLHCETKIRWTETMGWVHGGLGEGWNAYCDDTKTTEAEWGYDA